MIYTSISSEGRNKSRMTEKFKLPDNPYSGMQNVWHDSSVEKIIIEYNDIILILETDTGFKRIIFKNYIALEYIGQWDENIVAAIYEDRDHDFIEEALKKVKKCSNTTYRGGGTRDINSEWKSCVIKLIDNVCIKIVCDTVSIE